MDGGLADVEVLCNLTDRPASRVAEVDELLDLLGGGVGGNVDELTLGGLVPRRLEAVVGLEAGGQLRLVVLLLAVEKHVGVVDILEPERPYGRGGSGEGGVPRLELLDIVCGGAGMCGRGDLVECEDGVEAVGKLPGSREVADAEWQSFGMLACVRYDENRDEVFAEPVAEALYDAPCSLAVAHGAQAGDVVDDDDGCLGIEECGLDAVEQFPVIDGLGEVGIGVDGDSLDEAVSRLAPSLGLVLVLNVVEIDIKHTVSFVGDVLCNLECERGLAHARVSEEACALVLEPDVAPQGFDLVDASGKVGLRVIGDY